MFLTCPILRFFDSRCHVVYFDSKFEVKYQKKYWYFYESHCRSNIIVSHHRIQCLSPTISSFSCRVWSFQQDSAIKYMSLLVLGAEHRVNNVSKNVIEVTSHENNRTQNIHVACRSLYHSYCGNHGIPHIFSELAKYRSITFYHLEVSIITMT